MLEEYPAEPTEDELSLELTAPTEAAGAGEETAAPLDSPPRGMSLDCARTRLDMASKLVSAMIVTTLFLRRFMSVPPRRIAFYLSERMKLL
jgi:hypothetical protein